MGLLSDLKKKLDNWHPLYVHTPHKKLRTTYNFEVLILKTHDWINKRDRSTELSGHIDHFSGTAFTAEDNAHCILVLRCIHMMIQQVGPKFTPKWDNSQV